MHGYLRGIGAVVVLAALFAGAALAAPPVSADFRHPDAKRRIAAAEQAGLQKNRAAVDALIDLLRDRLPRVRYAAVVALHRIGDKRASRHLMVVAQTDVHERVREAARRAVRGVDPVGYVAKLATADKPPVLRLRARPRGSLRRQGRALVFASALGLNALRAEDTLGGLFGVGLRWPRAEGQLSLLFPAMGLAGQLRLNVLTSGRLIPYLTGGFSLLFEGSDDQPNGPLATLFVGAGVRARASSRWFFYAEVLASFIVSQTERAIGGSRIAGLRTVSLPLVVGVGVELWP